MTLVGHRAAPARGADEPTSRLPRSADATTILAFFVVLQLVLPARLVMNYLPLSLSAASLVALALGTLWLCAQLTTTLGAAKGRNPVRTMLFAYSCALLASYASAAFSFLPPDERAIGDHTMVIAFALIFVSLAVCDGVRSRERIYFLLHVVVVCGAIVAFVGILQFLLHFDPTPLLRPPGMHFGSFDPSTGSRDGLTRAAGTTSNPLEFGVFCAMVLPLAIHVAFRASKAGRRAAFWWTCVALVGGGLMFSVSRSAILGVVAAGLVLFAGWPARRRVWMGVAALGFLVVIKFASPGLLGTFLSLFQNANQDSSVQWRTHDYATARELIAQHLWLGRGIGTWYAPKHEVFDNQYLLTLVDSGVVGLVTLLGIFLAALYAAARVGQLCSRSTGRLPTAATDRDLALSVAASIAVVLPTWATFDFLAFPTVSALAFLVAGIAGALLRVVSAEAAGEEPDPYAIV
ncbi:MAG TPA: O-antigen ligase family protein [Nocardioides sp.]|uniref:O-antigen ligase family protein n=1 Tax=Nocardioides sp. TaxID=35761 RepID=UPI002E380AAE|nr:O-antigen ligase family protein [Nocardioides sp.]HEX5089020.1 O-antigen ligase family protein [Nocardioides sp.]